VIGTWPTVRVAVTDLLAVFVTILFETAFLGTA
jgi:preprotein translocase subunit SecE